MFATTRPTAPPTADVIENNIVFRQAVSTRVTDPDGCPSSVYLFAYRATQSGGPSACASVHFSPEKARELAEQLLRAANIAECQNAHDGHPTRPFTAEGCGHRLLPGQLLCLVCPPEVSQLSPLAQSAQLSPLAQLAQLPALPETAVAGPFTLDVVDYPTR